MSSSEVTKQSQARMMRGWMLGLHATHILDVGGRLGYFAELRHRGGSAEAAALAQALGLDAWRTRVWCQAAAAVGILRAESAERFGFAPHMDALVDDASPELLTSHVLSSLSRDFPAYPDAFRTGALKTFHDHDEDFFAAQAKVSALRAPVVVAAARDLPGMAARLDAGGRVLDVGSGSGTVVMRFAQEFPACRTTGVEPLPYFVDTSRRSIRGAGLDRRADVQALDATALPFEDEFDLITLVQVFHELPDARKADILRGCRRGLKPDGVLLIIDRCAPETAADVHDRRFTLSILEQWFEVTWGNVVNTRSEILAMLADTGFRVTHDTPDLVPTYWTFAACKDESAGGTA